MKQEIILGFVLIGIGALGVWFTKRYPEKGKDIFLLDYKGYLGALGLILIGIMIVWSAVKKYGW